VLLDNLLKKWLGTQGGAERANYQMFLTELCQALGLDAPDPKGAGLGDYQFEAPVKSEAALGTKGTGRIDLYKRDHFILEAKQSQLKPGEAPPADIPEPPPVTIHDLFGNPIGVELPKGRQQPRYDRLMADARIQAERYALALPDDHRTPPFLIVADIGRSFELYFDWAGNGRGYGPFPDERNYRISLADLASSDRLGSLDKTAAEVVRAIWTDPAGIDPRLRAVAVTRDIAERLSRVAAQLERDQRDLRPGDAEIALGIEATSLFLMRMLFCMFAEDVELLPKDSFKRFLADAKDRSDLFWRSGLTELWSKMNDPQEINRFWSHGDAIVRYFNGNLFANTRIFDLPGEFKKELLVAAGKDWRAVEPAIFGTLLEQVLTARDRARLGAHYTPRAYVERLVQATIMDVLGPEWEEVLAAARSDADAGDTAGAIARACAFHTRLVDVRVLDPACGTGNFLYVAMDALLRLETDIRQFVIGLGGTLAPAVHPNQFLGLELNPRAAVIAELVLWIGWLRYRLANTPEAIGEPVLPTLTNINEGTHGGFDAVLVRTATGEPDVENPRRPPWPEADFIVGNPPFIGGKDIRERLGAIYAEALWAANPDVPKSADFVMQWWDRAADILTREGTRLRRFGFVTTNSITQVFSRRVIERHIARDSPSPAGEGRKISLVLAVPDHPWTRATRDAAAVRIAMTAAEAGAREGNLIEIVSESKLDSDEPELGERVTRGEIQSDLTVGMDAGCLAPLKANDGICTRGVQLMGSGFVVTPAEAKELGLGNRPGLEAHVRSYLNGRDLLQRPRRVLVIDLFGLTESEVMERYPEVYDHLLKKVRDKHWNKDKEKWEGRAAQFERSPTADAKAYLETWWQFGKPRPELRSALKGLSRYIATTETAKHRIFQFIDATVLPDNMIVALASDDAFHLGVLSSRLHTTWSLLQGGTLESRPRWSKSRVFDPFAFPEPTEAQRESIAAIAERLEAIRRLALDENDKLTMTGLYNLVEAVRSGGLSEEQERAAVRARARIVAKLHDDLDAAVAAAYGWPADLPPLEIVARLVALNAERSAEERAGKIRWLRPDYQEPRFGSKVPNSAARAAMAEADLDG
jgi:hypothetical protein